jgi:glycosyltransferase involved in cell wall biosynthesis
MARAGDRVRILAVTEYYREENHNGSEVQCAELIDALRARHHVDVIARASDAAPHARRRPTWAVSDAALKDTGGLAEMLVRTVDVGAYDCVYNLGALLFGCRIVALLRLGYPELPLVNHFQALLGPYAAAEGAPLAECDAHAAPQHDAVRGALLNIFISHSQHRAAAESRMPIGRACAVIPNGLAFDAYDGVRPDRSPVVPARRNGFVIATGGRFVDYLKGGDLVYRAFAQLAADVPDAVLVSMANSDRFASILHDVAPDRWTVASWLPRPQFLAVLAGADLVVLPSRHEPFGLIAIEALAFGVPVLANAVGGLAEIVRDGEFGALNPLREGSFGLYAAMRALAADRPRLAAMGRAGRAHVRREYALARIAALVERELDRALRASYATAFVS